MCLKVLCCCETAALQQTHSLIVPNHERSVSYCPDFPCNDFNSQLSLKESKWDFFFPFFFFPHLPSQKGCLQNVMCLIRAGCTNSKVHSAFPADASYSS